MTTELKIENGKTRLPKNFKRLNSVKVQGNPNVLYCQQMDELFFGIKNGVPLEKCIIDYEPYNEEKLTAALAWMKKVYGGFPEHYYLEAARRCVADEWYENNDYSGENHWDGKPKSFHELFKETTEFYFKMKAVHLRYL